MLSSVACPALQHFFPHHGMIFEGKKSYWTLHACFHFLYKFFTNISHSKNNRERCDHKCILVLMQWACYSCQIWIKRELSPQIFEKFSNIRFRETPFSGGAVVHVDWRASVRCESSFTFSCRRSKQHQWALTGPATQNSSDFRIHKLEKKKLLVMGRGKKKCPARQCKVWHADRPNEANSHF